MMMRAALFVITAVLASGAPAESQSADVPHLGGRPVRLNLENPKLIDAVAVVLLANQDPEKFYRVSDELVQISVGTDIFEIRKMPDRECAFQQLNAAYNPSRLYAQVDFGRLTGEYQTSINSMGITVVRFYGNLSFCMKNNDKTDCYNNYDVFSGGAATTRRVLKAVSYIFDNFCSPLKPRTPF